MLLDTQSNTKQLGQDYLHGTSFDPVGAGDTVGGVATVVKEQKQQIRKIIVSHHRT